MLVRATDIGFDGSTIRNPDDEFDMPDGAKGSWFEPVHTESPDEPTPEPKRRGRPPKAK